MSIFIKRVSEKIGMPPGTLAHIGKQKTDKSEISLIDYDRAEVETVEAPTEHATALC